MSALACNSARAGLSCWSHALSRLNLPRLPPTSPRWKLVATWPHRMKSPSRARLRNRDRLPDSRRLSSRRLLIRSNRRSNRQRPTFSRRKDRTRRHSNNSSSSSHTGSRLTGNNLHNLTCSRRGSLTDSRRNSSRPISSHLFSSRAIHNRPDSSSSHRNNLTRRRRPRSRNSRRARRLRRHSLSLNNPSRHSSHQHHHLLRPRARSHLRPPLKLRHRPRPSP